VEAVELALFVGSFALTDLCYDAPLCSALFGALHALGCMQPKGGSKLGFCVQAREGLGTGPRM